MLIDFVVANHPRDHLPYRAGFAAVARGVFRIEPVEAPLGIVRRLLLGHQQCKTVALRQGGPAGAQIVAGGGLAASVQNDHKGGLILEVARRKRKHPETARIEPESGGFDEGTAGAGPQAPPITPEGIDSVQLWETSQEFDIVGERHRQLLDESSFQRPATTDSCCSAK